MTKRLSPSCVPSGRSPVFPRFRLTTIFAPCLSGPEAYSYRPALSNGAWSEPLATITLESDFWNV